MGNFREAREKVLCPERPFCFSVFPQRCWVQRDALGPACLNPLFFYAVGFTGRSGHRVGESKHRRLLPKAFITCVRDNKYVQRSHKTTIILIMKFKKNIYLLWTGFPVVSHKHHHFHPLFERQSLCIIMSVS